MRFFYGCMLCLCAVAHAADVKVTVDFSQPAYFPLDKTRAGIFQEADLLPGKNILESLKSHPELRFDSFRLLLSQGRETKFFNSPPQIQAVQGKIQVSADSDLVELLDFMRAARTEPIVTLFATPPEFRTKDALPTTMPVDLPAYTAAIQRYVTLFDKRLPMTWEIWNEPNLESFLHSENATKDYLRIYESVTTAVRASAPDTLIAGPCAAGAAKSLCVDFFKLMRAKPKLKPDYISFHYYGRFYDRFPSKRRGDKPTDFLEDIIVQMRKVAGDGYDAVPFALTEYEHFPSGEEPEIAALQQHREKTQGAVSFLSDQEFLITQPDIAYVNWNRLRKNGPEHRPGGVFDAEGTPMPHYYARLAYDALPEERVALTLPKGSDISGMASLGEGRAAVLLWSEDEGSHSIDLKSSGLPTDKFSTLTQARVTRYDAKLGDNHASPNVSKVSFNGQLQLKFQGPGFVLVELNGLTETAKPRELGGAEWLRSYRLCGREKDTITGNYAIPDARGWTVRLGTRLPSSEAAGGFRLGHLPKRITCDMVVRGGAPAPEFGALIIYDTKGKTDSVVFAPTSEIGEKVGHLPWNKETARYVGVFPENGGLNLDQYAPSGWSSGDRRAALLFWMRGAAVDTQAIVRLSAAEGTR